MKISIHAFWLASLLPCTVLAATPARAPQAVVAIPGGTHGIGFDDIQYIPALHRVAVPAGALGDLVLIDPTTDILTVMHGVSSSAPATTQHREGTTSVTYVNGYLFASDHDPAQVVTLDAHTGRVIGRTPLASGPDYVRYVARTHQLWITEPEKHQIQIFDVALTGTPKLKPDTAISIPGGPESLEVDNQRDRAYTNLWGDKTVELSLSAHRVLAEWANTCTRSHGIAIDEVHNHVFVACGDGKVVTLDPTDHGKVIASAQAGAGVDIVSYSAQLRHLYVPGAKAATLTVFDAHANGSLTPVATYHTARQAHCVTNDAADHVFVCDPGAGTILKFNDHRDTN